MSKSTNPTYPAGQARERKPADPLTDSCIPLLNQTNDSLVCCVCGSASIHGVIFGERTVQLRKQFACEQCAHTPYLSFPFKIPTVDGVNRVLVLGGSS